jgi:putative FmdB family regulatory protein
MPTYEYRCQKCKEQFERIEHVAEHGKAKLRCPKCGSQKVERVLSAFFAKTSRKS